MTDPDIDNFFKLEPHTILDAVESLSLKCTGRCLQLNSMENRVYEIELEEGQTVPSSQITSKYIVVKFYRPGRWSIEQIKAEHIFLKQLADEEIGVVPAISFNNESLFTCPTTGIYFCIYPKFSGRNADEFNKTEIQIIARSLARIHQVGARQIAKSRTILAVDKKFEEYCDYLVTNKVMPQNFSERIIPLITQFRQLAEPFVNNITPIRIHGDAHKGNLIKRNDSFYWVDFDDFCNGPPVQDLWLLFPGRDQEARSQLKFAVDSYGEFSNFDQHSLYLIEPLRSLRVLYFNVWIHKRWSDPYFKRTFETFGKDNYWQEQLSFFSEQLTVFAEIISSADPLLVI